MSTQLEEAIEHPRPHDELGRLHRVAGHARLVAMGICEAGAKDWIGEELDALESDVESLSQELQRARHDASGISGRLDGGEALDRGALVDRERRIQSALTDAGGALGSVLVACSRPATERKEVFESQAEALFDAAGEIRDVCVELKPNCAGVSAPVGRLDQEIPGKEPLDQRAGGREALLGYLTGFLQERLCAVRSAEAKDPVSTEHSEELTDPLHPYDIALLEFLSSNRGRVFVEDIKPVKGPRDRKGIGQRLRRLAMLGLVDYCPAKKQGAAITSKGKEALHPPQPCRAQNKARTAVGGCKPR